MPAPTRLLYCYAQEDMLLRQALEKHLTPLVRAQLLTSWHEQLIMPGGDVRAQLEQQLTRADILLLLVSADFVASDACMDMVARALQQHDAQRIRVVPVIVRPVDWQSTMLGGLDALPQGGKPVIRWSNVDDAWLDVERSIRNILHQRAQHTSVAGDDGPLNNPYRGLATFDVDDEGVFFGREELTRQLWQRFYQIHKPSYGVRPRLLAVLGPSGSGKSSVIRAGLVPALQRHPIQRAEPPRLVVMRPGDQPLLQLARALAPLLPDREGVLKADQIAEMVEARLNKPGGLGLLVSTIPEVDKTGVLLLVDQFEELYAQCRDPALRSTFVSRLLEAAIAQDRQVSVILTLRTDFQDEVRRHPELSQAIANGQVMIPALGRDALMRIITLPAEQRGHLIDSAVTEQLIGATLGREGALPLLEFCLARIWEGLMQGRQPVAMLDALGGVGGALAAEAEQVFTRLSQAEQGIAERAFLGLVQLGEGTRDTRRRVLLSELTSSEETTDAVHHVLRRFAEGPAECAEGPRLVTLSEDESVQGGDRRTAEVTHEALFDNWATLQGWVEAGRADLRFHRWLAQAALRWHQLGQHEGSLWRAPELELLLQFSKRRPRWLTTVQTAFLRESEALEKREQEAEQQRLFAEERSKAAEKERALRQQQQRAEELARLRRHEIIALTAGLVVSIGALGAVGYLYQSAERLRYRAEETARREMGLRATVLSQTPGRQAEAISTAMRALHGETRGQPPAAEVLAGLVNAVGDSVASRSLSGHQGEITSAVFSPDGQRVLTASKDITARIWDARDGSTLLTLTGHEAPVAAADYSPDGSRIVTASWDQTARVWDAATGATILVLRGHGAILASVAYSADGMRIVTTSRDRTARIWDAATGELLHVLTPHPDFVSAAVFSKDGGRVVTAGKDAVIRLWDVGTGALIGPIRNAVDPASNGSLPPQHTKWIRSIALSPQGTEIVTSSDDRTARLWDTETGQVRHVLAGHEGGLVGAAFSADGKRIVTAGLDGTARIWDARTGRCIMVLRAPSEWVTAASFSPDGKRVAVGGDDGRGQIWDIVEGTAQLHLAGHQKVVQSVGFSPDGRRIVTAAEDHTARIWDAADGRELLTLPEHGGIVYWAQFSPDGQQVVTASGDREARLFTAGTGALAQRLTGHAGSVFSSVFSQDGTQIVTASEDRTARIWDRKGRLLRTLGGHQGRVLQAVFSSDGKRILTASEDQTARIWDAERGQVLVTLLGHQGPVASAVFSRDASQVVTAGHDQTVRIWDVARGTLKRQLTGHAGRVVSVEFSADGRVMAGSYDKTVRIWDAASGRLLLVLGAPERLCSVSYSPDGRKVAYAAMDGSVSVSPSSLAPYLDIGCSLLQRVRTPIDDLRSCLPEKR